MGWEAHQVSAKFYVKHENVLPLFKAAQALAKNALKKNERMYGVDLAKAANADTPEKQFDAWGFEISRDAAGDIFDIKHNGMQLASEEEFFKVIASFVQKGSVIEMAGAEQSRWRWCFDGKNFKEEKARLVFD